MCPAQQQRGYCLIVTMIMILIMATLSANTINAALLESAMARSQQDTKALFQRAESGQRYAVEVMLPQLLVDGANLSMGLSREIPLASVLTGSGGYPNPTAWFEQLNMSAMYRIKVEVYGLASTQKMMVIATYRSDIGGLQQLSWKYL